MLNTDNFYPICLFTRENIEWEPDYTKRYKYSRSKAKGLSNQLFALTNGIIEAIHKQKNFIIIDSFLTCINTNKICKISDILDLNKITQNLLNNDIKIYLIDRNNIKLSFVSVKYGVSKSENIDITSVFKTFERKFSILNTQNFNEIVKTDPYPNRPKFLYLQYKIGEYIINETIPEHKTKLKYTLSFDSNKLEKRLWFNKITNFNWYNKYDVVLFNKILKYIVFNKVFYQIIDFYKDNYNITKNNIVHYRLETDAIMHWSKQNRMDPTYFKKTLQNIYTNLINNNLSPKNSIYLLTDNNDVSINNFTVTNIDKDIINQYINIRGREIRAIVDLLLAIQCSNTFIGCHNLKLSRGSSFSYIIHVLGNFEKKIFIDLDDIFKCN